MSHSNERKQDELTEEELEQQEAAELPDREAMSLIQLGEGLGVPPIEGYPPQFTLPYEKPSEM